MGGDSCKLWSGSPPQTFVTEDDGDADNCDADEDDGDDGGGGEGDIDYGDSGEDLKDDRW